MFLIFSDLHIYTHKGRNNRLEDCIDALKWVFDVAKERKVSHVICVGDLFHDRQIIDILTYQTAFQVFADNSQEDFQVHLLIGNHDCWYSDKWNISSVVPLSSVDNISVISAPTEVTMDGHNVAFLPYTKNPARDLKNVGGDILFAHVAIDGALWNVYANTRADVIIEHDGEMEIVSPDIFDRWKRVFLGHYHAEQQLSDTVEYVGSPLQLTFGEAFQHKHIILYDPETDTREYIRNTFSPQHFIIPEADLGKYDLNKNFVRVIVDDISSSDIIETRERLLAKYDVGSLKFEQRPKEIQRHIIADAKAILFKEEDMLERYIEEVGTDGLNKEVLLKIGKSIVKKVKGKQK